MRLMTGRGTVFLFSLSVFISSIACANNLKIPDFYSEPGINSARAYEGGAGNEVIDPFSGGLIIQYRDIVLPGPGGMDIVVNRTYRSLQGAEPALEQQQERRVAGIGWDINFGRVWLAPDTVLCTTAGSVTTGPDLPSSYRNPVFEGPDGSRKVLATEYSGTTPYHMISKDRWVATCLDAADNPWSNITGMIVQSPDGMKYTHGVRGRIEIGNQANNLPLLVNRIEDRNGNWIEIEYDRATTSYALIDRVIASDGREIKFHYIKGSLPEDVRLDRITAFPGTPDERTWRYFFSEAQFTSSFFTSPWYLLDRVESPESDIVWRYSYYPDDPDGPDPVTGKYDAGRFSLQRVTLPEGGLIDYQYTPVVFDTRPGAFGDDIVTTAVSQKIQSGPSISSGTWLYDYRPYSVDPGAANDAASLNSLVSDVDFPTLDETRIIGPQYCTTYKHVGIKSINFSAIPGTDDGVWTVGLLLERKVYPGTACSGTELERETIKWGKQTVTTQNEFRPTRSAIDENTYAALMLEKTVRRDGTDYVTAFSNYDQYGNAQTVVEQGQDARTTNYTYAPNTDKWLLRLIELETIVGIGDIDRLFDANGNMNRETKYGVTTQWNYYTTGDVAIERNALNRDTNYSNYFRGIARLEEHPESVTISRTVGNPGTVLSETNGRGKTTQYTYDDLNRVTSIARPVGAVTNITRPSANEVILTRGGFEKREILDGLGRVITTSNKDTVTSETIQTTITYDEIGNKVFESYPNSILGTTTTYDSLGRVLTQSIPDSATTQFAYLANNQVTITDPRSKQTRYFYRSFGSPDQRSIERIESPESVTTDISRNALDLITSIQQGGLVRNYAYDTRYYLESETQPEVGTIDYLRDQLGNKRAETYYTTSGTRNIQFTYDQLNRLVLTNYPGATPDISYSYDGNSNITSVLRGATGWAYAYDDNDNLESEILTIGGQQLGMAYQYNALDALSNITYPSGLTVAYAPNRYGWPSQASGFVNSVTYHPSGHLKTIQYANGIQQTIQLNNRLLPSSISAGVIDLGYQYDLAGNVTQIIDALDPVKNVDMVYDDINRLTAANGAWGVGSFTYDVIGNLTGRNINGQPQTYAYNPTTNLLDSVAGATNGQLAYDVFANVTSDGNRSYVYDDSSDLVQVVSGSAFEYDGNKRRTVEQKSGDIIYTLYSQAGQLMYEYDETNLVSKEYIRLGSTLAAIRKDTCDETSTDSDGDGIPDCAEDFLGLDRNDPADASLDADGDGLTNLQEYQLKTDLFSPDTDGDGMPDGYEVQQGHDPLVNDASVDTDSDGYTNLQEYEGISDPNDPGSIPNGAVLWSQTLLGVASFPAIADSGEIYVLSGDSTSVSLLAYSPDGSLLWSRALPGTANCTDLDSNKLRGQVAVGRSGTVYASCTGFGTFAYNPAGTQLWSYPVGGFLSVTDTHVYVSPVRIAGVDVAQVHALDSATGTQDWLYSVYSPDGGFGNSIVTDRDGTVYAVTGCDLGGCYWDEDFYDTVDVHAINPDGTPKWIYRDIGNVYGMPAIGIDGSLYFGVGPRGSEGVYQLIALNPDGSFQRSFEIRIVCDECGSGGLPKPAPTLGVDGTIYTFTENPWAINPDFSERWGRIEGLYFDNADSNPLLVADSGNLYISAAGELLGFRDTGTQAWRSDYIDFDRVTMGPDGSFVNVSTPNSSILVAATNNDDGRLAASTWPMEGGNARQSRSVAACDPLDTDADGLPDCYEQRIGTDPADPLDAALDPDADGLTHLDEYAAGTHPYNSDTDADQMPDGYEVGLGLDPRSNTYALDTDGDGALDAIEYRTGSNPASASSVPAFGTQIWSMAVNGVVESAPVQHRDHNPVFTGIGEVDYVGNTVWSWSFGGIHSTMPMITGNQIYGVWSPPYNTIFATTLDGVELNYLRGLPSTETGPGFARGAAGELYYSRSPATLYNGSPNVTWSQTLTADVTTAPAVDSTGRIVVGTADGIVYVLDGAGTELWSFATLGAIQGSPAIGSDDTIYIPSNDGRLYALASDGALVWSFTIGGNLTTAPVIGADGTVYLAAENGSLYAISPIGTMLWSYATGGAIRANPVIGSDGNIYFGSDDGFVYAVRPDGTLAGQADVGAPVGVASPYIGDKGVLYIGTSDSRLLGLYVGVTGIADAPWPTIAHDAHRTGNVTTQLGNGDQPPVVQILSPQDGSMHAEGGLVVLDATATDIENGDLTAGISWTSSLDGLLGSGGHLELSTLTVGHHTLTASVFDSGQNITAQTVEIDVGVNNVVVTVATDLASPQTEGATVVVSGSLSGSTQPYEYRIRVKGDATNDQWQVLSGFSPTTSVLWDTSGYRGRNRLQVTVREPGTTGQNISSGLTFWVNGVDAATGVTLATDVASPQTVGQPVTVSAVATGGPGPYEYRFEVRSVTQDGAWQLLQDYSTQMSTVWDTTAWPGHNRLRVFARQAGFPDKPVKQGSAYWLNEPNAATDAALTLTPSGAQPAGTLINLLASAVGGSGSYDYEFQLKGPSTGDQWVVLQGWSNVASYDWDTTGLLGQHRVRVRLRNTGTDDKPVNKGKNVEIQ